ncbi:MAG: hypothetical protein J1F09_07120 [Oscillospiraceae bacterium]|nr:hypothetical protein [Oscillospiraceae bacterium]
MQFLSTVCIAAIATALFRMLVPENKFKKQISFLIAGVFLLTGVTAAMGAEIDLSADHYDIGSSADYIGFSGDVNRSLQKKICDDMSDRLYKLLNDNEIYPKEIHVIVNISGLYSINITGVKLVFNAGEQAAAEAAAKLLSRELPEDIKVTVEVKE